jgi:hypothetical protein
VVHPALPRNAARGRRPHMEHGTPCREWGCEAWSIGRRRRSLPRPSQVPVKLGGLGTWTPGTASEVSRRLAADRKASLRRDFRRGAAALLVP